MQAITKLFVISTVMITGCFSLPVSCAAQSRYNARQVDSIRKAIGHFVLQNPEVEVGSSLSRDAFSRPFALRLHDTGYIVASYTVVWKEPALDHLSPETEVPGSILPFELREPMSHLPSGTRLFFDNIIIIKSDYSHPLIPLGSFSVTIE